MAQNNTSNASSSSKHTLEDLRTDAETLLSLSNKRQRTEQEQEQSVQNPLGRPTHTANKTTTANKTSTTNKTATANKIVGKTVNQSLIKPTESTEKFTVKITNGLPYIFVSKFIVGVCLARKKGVEMNLSNVFFNKMKVELSYQLPDSMDIFLDVKYNGSNEKIRCIHKTTYSNNVSKNGQLEKLHSLILCAKSKGIIERLIEEAIRVLVSKPKIMRFDKSDWYVVGELHVSQEHFIDKVKLDDVFSDVEKFVESEKAYEKFGQKYKRSYLFQDDDNQCGILLSQLVAIKLNCGFRTINMSTLSADEMMKAIGLVPCNTMLMIDVEYETFKNKEKNNVLFDLLQGKIGNSGLVSIIRSIRPSPRFKSFVPYFDKIVNVEIGILSIHQIDNVLKKLSIDISTDIIQKLTDKWSNVIDVRILTEFLFKNRNEILNDETFIKMFDKYWMECMIDPNIEFC